MSHWLAYLCATQGHLVTGQGWGTGPGQTVWATHCQRCGADLRPHLSTSGRSPAVLIP